MDSADDIDIFADSSDEMSLGDPLETAVIEGSADCATPVVNQNERNPVKEHLLKQLNEVDERVTSTKRQIEETTSLKEKILQKFSSRSFYGESSSSSSESDLFTVSGEPIVKRRRKSKRSKIQPLVLKSTWQYVTDDKWIVGVMLQNMSDQDLYELDLHVTIKNVDEFSGISSFWTKDSKAFWRRTDIAKSDPKNDIAATVVVDLPKFTNNSTAELFGTITYELDEKILQTLIPRVTLSVDKIMEGEHDLSFSKSENDDTSDLVQAIISTKSLSIEKITDFKVTHALSKDMGNILVDIGFEEILPKVYLGRRNSKFDRCILELTNASVFKYRSIIYSRSITQLNMMLHILHNALPKGTTISCRNVSAEGVIQAFETELNMYLTTGNSVELQEAIVKSDLISEEFENGCTIFNG